MAPPANRNQLAFRGVAALSIVLGHLLFIPIYDLGFADHSHWGWLAYLIFFRFLAVDGFFMLSGCLLALHYWDHFTPDISSRQIDRFYLKRLARIYPLHLFATALIGLYALLNIPHPISSGLQVVIFEHWLLTGLLNLLLMQGWGIVPVASWNEPAWTLSILFLLYVLFPNLVLIARRIRQLGGAGSQAVAAWAPLWLIAGLLVGYYVLRQWVDFGSNSDGAGAIVRGLVMFICGMALARLQQANWQAQRPWDRLFALSLLGFIALVALWWRFGPFDMFGFHLLLPVLVLGVMRADGRTARLFANPLTCWLGTMSYSLYLLHYPVMMLMDHLGAAYFEKLAGAGSFGLIAAYALAIGLVIGLCWLGYKLVERPLSRAVAYWLHRQN